MLTVPQGTALYVGAVLGTGVIALPALAAQAAGPASLLAWIALVALSVPLAATFAALGARYPDAGGVATYVRTAFGDRSAAVVGWTFYFAVPVGSPPAALFGGAYVANAMGGGHRTALAAAAGLMLVVTVANALGLQVSARLQLGLAALLVALLVTATVTALPHARLANLHPFAPHGWTAIAPAAAILVWSFAGWEAITSLAGEFRRPARDLPRATAAALVVVGVLYLGIAGAGVLVLGRDAGSSPAPLADLLAIGVGGPVRVVAAVAAVLLTTGTMNAYYAGAARLGTALARDGALPAFVQRRSLFIVSGLGAVVLGVMAVTGLGARTLVLLTTGSFVLVYALGAAAAIRLLPRRSWARRSAVVSLAAVAALFVSTGYHLAWALGVAVLALAYMSVRTRRSAIRALPALREGP